MFCHSVLLVLSAGIEVENSIHRHFILNGIFSRDFFFVNVIAIRCLFSTQSFIFALSLARFFALYYYWNIWRCFLCAALWLNKNKVLTGRQRRKKNRVNERIYVLIFALFATNRRRNCMHEQNSIFACWYYVCVCVFVCFALARHLELFGVVLAREQSCSIDSIQYAKQKKSLR